MDLINLEHLLIACIVLMFLRDMANELNKKGADNGKERQYEVMAVSREDRPEVHEESKSERRVHSDRSSVPTDDSD
jgi:hypothetical protein